MTTPTQDEIDRQAFEEWFKDFHMKGVNNKYSAPEVWKAAIKHQREASAKELAECQKERDQAVKEMENGWLRVADSGINHFKKEADRAQKALAECQAREAKLRRVLEMAEVGSCTCGTITHEYGYHDDDCRYRIISEVLADKPDHSALDQAIAKATSDLQEALAEVQEREVMLLNKAVEAALREAVTIVRHRKEIYSNAGEAHPENSIDRDRCFARANAALDIERDILTLIPKPEKG